MIGHARGGSTVVEHLARHPKVKGSSSATASGIGSKKWQKVSLHMRTCNDVDAPSNPNIKFYCQPTCLASKIDKFPVPSSTIINLKSFIEFFKCH